MVKLGDKITIDNPNNSNARWGVVVDILCGDTIYFEYPDGVIDIACDDEIQAIQIGFDNMW